MSLRRTRRRASDYFVGECIQVVVKQRRHDQRTDTRVYVARTVRTELTTSYASSSKGTKRLCAVLASAYAAHALFANADSFFALQAYAVMTRPWVLVTSGYYEMTFAALCFDVCGLLYIGKSLEPIWGATELLRFVVGVNIAVATMSWISMFFLYVISAGDEFYLFAKFGGFHGVLAALMLALRQVLPEEPVFAEGALLRALRNKHLIGAYLTFTAVYAFMSGGRHHHIGLYLFDIWGAYGAWVYLRYFQPHGAGMPRGDASADFAFAALFPPHARPVIARVSAPLHAVATKFTRRSVVQAPPDVEAALPKLSSTMGAHDAVVRAKLENNEDEDDDSTHAKREARKERARKLLEAREDLVTDGMSDNATA